ncbi:DUF4030 domain-containing protein [Pseudoneobacillus sp. C159]
MEYRKEDQIKSLEDLQIPSSLDQFLKELPGRYQNGDMNKEVEERTEHDWLLFQQRLKKKKKNRLIGLSSSLVAACCLFVGAAFVSPAVAEIASEIPYLNLIFKSKPLHEEIEKALKAKKITYRQLRVDIPDKDITVNIEGPKSYYQTVKQPTEELIRGILNDKNYDAYSIKVTHGVSPEEAELLRKFQEAEERNKELSAELDQVSESVYEVLARFGYDKGGVGVSKGRIDLNYIPNTETRVEEMKASIIEKLEQEGLSGYKVKVYLYDPTLVDREERFLPLYHAITEGLVGKKEYKVKTVGYTNKYKDRFYISVATTISPDDIDKEETLEKIERTVREFLQSKEALNTIQNDQYEIVIHSKKQKEKLRIIKSNGLE